jgi:chemotaxis protein methyltransferase CheR
MDNEREFRFTKQDFDLLRRLVNEQTGITLSDHKQEMLYSRLSRRLRALNLDSFSNYYHLLKEEGGEELVHFINAVTTNLTAFFREPHHFSFLAQQLFPKLMEEKHDTKRIRIWSAGCASGEEPYSIAIVVKEFFPYDWDVKILATDLDSSMIERGGRGIYEAERVNGIAEERLSRWFRKGKGVQAGKVHISPELQEMVVFKQLNLMHPWPLQGPLDIIFCRNVVIYFDKATQRVLFDRFANLLKLDGFLFVGHSENLFQLTTRFQLQQQTIYKKII